MDPIDRLITAFDKGLRTVFVPAPRPNTVPGDGLTETALTAGERSRTAALMRVNHSGEVCAQALYEGQALTARNSNARKALEDAAREETVHLAWTERRIEELGGRKSLFNPLWYAGSFALGAVAGVAGDRWNLGFLAETERQVVEHLDGHLKRLPAEDHKSRAILEQMRADEARHATSALAHGATELPALARGAMRLASRVMTGTAYWL